jgi:hypothetical protein
MGNCATIKQDLNINNKTKEFNNNDNLKETDKKIEDAKDKEKDKKNLSIFIVKDIDLNGVFEEIGDIKDMQIKGAMLLSETVGRPRETYETLENIAPGNRNS